MSLLVALPAQAEYALLRNGQRLHITGYENVGETVSLHVSGGRVEISAADLVAIEPEEVFPSAPRREPDVPFGNLIREAAKRHGVDERLIISVIRAESNFNPRAVSRRKARGLMQLMPATAARFAVTDVFDPAQNIHAGTRYLKELIARYAPGNAADLEQGLRLALAAYNAGPERVARWRGVPPFPETQTYVRRVLRLLAEHRQFSGD